MGGSDEEKYDHPTQKPVELMRRPILNHTRPATWSMIRSWVAAPRSPPRNSLTAFVTDRTLIQIAWTVVVQRWQSLSNRKATLEGDGRTFDEIAQERLKEAGT